MGKPLSERFIQQSVAERLNKDYYRRRTAYVSTEAYTKLKRADVLLAFMRAPKRPYVVVVEAKSRTTIRQLRLSKHGEKGAGRLLSVVLLAFVSAYLGHRGLEEGWAMPVLVLALIGSNLALYFIVMRVQLRFLRSVPAIRQLGQYPANESWLAVGKNTLRDPIELSTLRKHCRKNGVGLILVDARGRLFYREIPRPRHIFNDYLSRYGRRSEILATIDHQPTYGPTPPEKRQNRRRLFSVLVILLVVAGLVMLVYGEDPIKETSEGSIPALPTPEGVDIGGGPVDFEALADTTGDATPTANPTPPRCPELKPNEVAYVVVDGLYADADASVRMTRLRAAGIRGHEMIAATCLDRDARAPAAVTTGKRYAGPQDAREAARRYRALLASLRVPVDTVEVRRLGSGE
ncbi:hypothetical protein [Lewinella sp. IMCC34191]|uniref:hypothetical protein n=1 Tax=Lewinella sp. IMCC34191 TaxID=2259172 RepID=UPI000E2320EB|nr:hypothetical protein [Lewinella sp. IMCC34191]